MYSLYFQICVSHNYNTASDNIYVLTCYQSMMHRSIVSAIMGPAILYPRIAEIFLSCIQGKRKILYPASTDSRINPLLHP